MAFDPLHGHAALRRGRRSESGAEYFLTFCTLNKKQGLAVPSLAKPIKSAASKLETESLWTLRTGVIMPDHIHFLISLGSTASLTDAVRLFKGRLSPVLRQAGLRWQPAYFDHRLRAGEDVLPVFLYIFLNPYRAGLIPQAAKWSGYYCCANDWSWFEPLTNAETPFPEWLAG